MRAESEIKRRFSHPTHALVGSDVANESCLMFRAGGVEQGAVAEVYLCVQESRLEKVRFRAYGSPTLIAFADAFCEALEGLRVDSLAEFELLGLQQQLAVPNTEIHVVMLFNELLQDLRQGLTTAVAAAGGS